eukprot:CAMPEP_0184671020 /NCGR_PEP_ID=MMETSP0308-20130426/84985_1 /TAXON_ID=38269 /ORGANISM="Gloeochaete witrockiana, Strain SAG 46.84" /LENGTH=537 /DNA_ID=CAMNT_0027118017 /DNA_START=113 /DNA_END=1723 /DNA_ORIENTATION=+
MRQDTDIPFGRARTKKLKKKTKQRATYTTQRANILQVPLHSSDDDDDEHGDAFAVDDWAFSGDALRSPYGHAPTAWGSSGLGDGWGSTMQRSTRDGNPGKQYAKGRPSGSGPDWSRWVPPKDTLHHTLNPVSSHMKLPPLAIPSNDSGMKVSVIVEATESNGDGDGASDEISPPAMRRNNDTSDLLLQTWTKSYAAARGAALNGTPTAVPISAIPGSILQETPPQPIPQPPQRNPAPAPPPAAAPRTNAVVPLAPLSPVASPAARQNNTVSWIDQQRAKWRTSSPYEQLPSVAPPPPPLSSRKPYAGETRGVPPRAVVDDATTDRTDGATTDEINLQVMGTALPVTPVVGTGADDGLDEEEEVLAEHSGIENVEHAALTIQKAWRRHSVSTDDWGIAPSPVPALLSPQTLGPPAPAAGSATPRLHRPAPTPAPAPGPVAVPLSPSSALKGILKPSSGRQMVEAAAASTIQSSFKHHKRRQNFRHAMMEKRHAAKTIQKFWRKRAQTPQPLRPSKFRTQADSQAAVMVQSAWRGLAAQ